jgi:hypothetical protein
VLKGVRLSSTKTVQIASDAAKEGDGARIPATVHRSGLRKAISDVWALDLLGSAAMEPGEPDDDRTRLLCGRKEALSAFRWNTAFAVTSIYIKRQRSKPVGVLSSEQS